MIKYNGKDIIPRIDGKEISRVMFNGKQIYPEQYIPITFDMDIRSNYGGFIITLLNGYTFENEGDSCELTSGVGTTNTPMINGVTTDGSKDLILKFYDIDGTTPIKRSFIILGKREGDTQNNKNIGESEGDYEFNVSKWCRDNVTNEEGKKLIHIWQLVDKGVFIDVPYDADVDFDTLILTEDSPNEIELEPTSIDTMLEDTQLKGTNFYIYKDSYNTSQTGQLEIQFHFNDDDSKYLRAVLEGSTIRYYYTAGLSSNVLSGKINTSNTYRLFNRYYDKREEGTIPDPEVYMPYIIATGGTSSDYYEKSRAQEGHVTYFRGTKYKIKIIRNGVVGTFRFRYRFNYRDVTIYGD